LSQAAGKKSAPSNPLNFASAALALGNKPHQFCHNGTHFSANNGEWSAREAGVAWRGAQNVIYFE